MSQKIKTNHLNVNSSKYIDFEVKNNDKDFKFNKSDCVKISKKMFLS